MTDPTAVPVRRRRVDAASSSRSPTTRVTGGRLKTRIALKAGQTTILVFGHDLRRCRMHATSTTADAVRADGANLVARAATPGTYTTTLSDGRSVADDDRVASRAAQPLTHWTLDVDDFLPGATPTQTLHATHTLTLDGLKAWSDIPELADVSGIGTLHDHGRLGRRRRRLPRPRRGLRHLPRERSTASRSRRPTSCTRRSTSART